MEMYSEYGIRSCHAAGFRCDHRMIRLPEGRAEGPSETPIMEPDVVSCTQVALAFTVTMPGRRRAAGSQAQARRGPAPTHSAGRGGSAVTRSRKKLTVSESRSLSTVGSPK
eukprot:135860-Hanusia_phi.AAC.1